MRYKLLLAIGLVACGTSSTDRPAAQVTTFRGLLDSLAVEGGCPRNNLPQIAPLQESMSVALTTTDECALVAAALRKLGGVAVVDSVWAPADTSKVVKAAVFARPMTAMDTAGVVISGPDTIGRVELDIEGRPRPVWIQYQVAAPRETIGAVHRGPIPPN